MFRRGRAGRHHHPVAGVAPGRGQRGQWQQVAGVVGADHQRVTRARRHPATGAAIPAYIPDSAGPSPGSCSGPAPVGGPPRPARVPGSTARSSAHADRDGGRRAGVDQEPGDGLVDVRGRTARVGLRPRQSGGQRLDQRQPELLLEAAAHVHAVRGDEPDQARCARRPSSAPPHRSAGARTSTRPAAASGFSAITAAMASSWPCSSALGWCRSPPTTSRLHRCQSPGRRPTPRPPWPSP